MIRLSKIILFFTAVVLLAWLLPWTYRFLTVRPDRDAFYPIQLRDGEFRVD